MKTLVVEYDGKRKEAQIKDNQFGAYNLAYREKITAYFNNKFGVTKEVKDLSTEILTLSDKDALIIDAQDKVAKVKEAMKSVKIYIK